MTDSDFYLDKEAAQVELANLGLKLSVNQVQRLMIDREIPVFLFRNKLVVERKVLRNYFKQRQKDAISGAKNRKSIK